LITNGWGRPLEFRLTTAVQPNRVQQILYGATLLNYVHADLIGKSLVEKAGMVPQLLVTDSEKILDLRWHVDVPTVCLCPADQPGGHLIPMLSGRSFICHSDHSADAQRAFEIFQILDGVRDLAEPFERIREALTEARKMGATSRAA
jgi:hypothetical protein